MSVKKVDVYKEINNPNRNFFISASAGTGKTYLLTQYYIKILEKNYPNSEIVDRILAVTFTNKAALEMKSRIVEAVTRKLEEKVPSNYTALEWYKYWNEIKINMSRSWIKTIDSFCSRIIRENNVSIGVDPNFSIISDFQRDREIERSVNSSLRVALELYQDQEIDWINLVSKKRNENIENYIKELLKDKERFKDTFKKILKEKSIDEIREMLSTIVRNWRLEMSRAKIADEIELADENLSAIYANFLWFIKIVSLIASEFYIGLTIDLFMYDFKGVLEKVIEILNDDTILKKYQNKFKYIIVDEFQDTNYLQKEIFDKLHTSNNYFFYVGDRKQSIYRFRGADVSVFSKTLTQIENSGEEVAVGELKTNRRSHREIVDFSNFLSKEVLFKKENIQIEEIEPILLDNLSFKEGDISEAELAPMYDEKIPSLTDNDKKRVKFILVEDDEELHLGNAEERVNIETEVVAKAITRLLGQEHDFRIRKDGKATYERRKIEPKDIAILTRDMKNIEEPLRKILSKYAIPFYIVGSKSFYNKPEIQAIFSAMSCVQNPYNDYEFVKYMMSALVGLSLQDLSKLIKNRSGSLFETFEKIKENYPKDIVNSYEVIKKYSDLKYYLPPSTIFKGIINENNYFLKLSLTNDPESSISNVRKLINQAEEYNRIANSFSELIRFLKKASVISEEEASLEGETSNSVKVMTIHKSKGLEFPIVFLIGLHDSLEKKIKKPYIEFSLPDTEGNRYYILKNIFKDTLENTDNWLFKWFRNNDFLERTETHRIAYVGITRAKDLLIPILLKNSRASSMTDLFLNALDSEIDIINFRDIKEKSLEKSYFNENVFKEIPTQNFEDFNYLSYKKYIAPTYLINELKPSEAELIEDIENKKEVRTLFFEPKNIFSDEERLFKGSELHDKLQSAQTLSHIRNMIENGELPKEFDEIEIVKKAFTQDANTIIKNEWRLMKHFYFEGKNYMLFGIPDKVIIKNNEIEILDYKYSDLRDKKKINDYKFQILFYLYLLSDFGIPKAGYILSIKTLKEPIKIEYESDFEKELIKRITNHLKEG